MTAPAPPPSTLFGLSSVAVLGAGWLGRPLALALAAAGYRVRVSTTSAEKSAALAAENLPAHLLVLEPDSAPTDWQAFLGLADPGRVSLGFLISEAQPHLQYYWWLSVFPGLVLVTLVVGLNLAGEALNDLLNPRAEPKQLPEGGAAVT